MKTALPKIKGGYKGVAAVGCVDGIHFAIVAEKIHDLDHIGRLIFGANAAPLDEKKCRAVKIIADK